LILKFPPPSDAYDGDRLMSFDERRAKRKVERLAEMRAYYHENRESILEKQRIKREEKHNGL
jgi:hypothetical protein